ncbi:MAG: sialidase family protein, partial [Bacteroidota bacterium]|nr:sialidase family protein [Bacteroidota bacterium]
MKKCIALFLFALLFIFNAQAQTSFKNGMGKSSDYSSPYWFPFQNANKADSSQPQSILLHNGKLMIVYAANSNPDTIFCRTSTDEGVNWSAPHYITSIAKPSGLGSFIFSGIVTNTNRVLLCYSLSNPYITTKIIKSDDDGNTWLSPVGVYPSVNIPVPSMSKSSDGKIFITGYGTTYFLSTNNGVTWNPKDVDAEFKSIIQT